MSLEVIYGLRQEVRKKDQLIERLRLENIRLKQELEDIARQAVLKKLQS
jgi:hypothetical protein